MRSLMHLIRPTLAEEAGQGMVEYALVLALVSLVSIGALTSLGGQYPPSLTAVSNTLASAL